MKKTRRKGFNFFRSYFDVYNELETDADKVAFMDALLNRQFLGEKPTNLTGLAKFAYISQVSSIDAQVKGFEDKTGIILNPNNTDGLPNPYEGGTEGATKGGNEPPTRQVEVEVEVEEEEKGEDIKRFSFRKNLRALGVSEQLATDFLKNRRAKRLANTETAFNRLKIELGKVEEPINEIFEAIVSNGWASFKASWDLKKEKKGPTPEKKKKRAWDIVKEVRAGNYKPE